MKRPAIHRTSREPIDRRQLRLIHALLAFPVAGVIGFTGNAIVKSVRSDLAPITSPARPDPAGEEQPASYEPDDEQDSPRETSHVARNV